MRQAASRSISEKAAGAGIQFGSFSLPATSRPERRELSEAYFSVLFWSR
jgi:hypothetical protein